MNGLVKVRLGKKDFLIPHHALAGLMRITNHPTDAGKLLVWRHGQRETGEGGESLLQRGIFVHEARKVGKEIMEGSMVASLDYDAFLGTNDRKAWVKHFLVNPDLRRKTVGIALVETLLQDLKSKRVEDVWFPPHLQAGFYLKRGFKEDIIMKGHERRLAGYVGDVRKLGVKPAGIKLKVLWQRAKPRFAK